LADELMEDYTEIIYYDIINLNEEYSTILLTVTILNDVHCAVMA